MASFRRGTLVVAALGASALASAALTGTATAATSQSSACVDKAMNMSRYLRQTTDTPGSATHRHVAQVIDRIKAASTDCIADLFADGTASHPDAGLLGGDGFSYSLEGSCIGTAPCNGGNAGKLTGNGGDGWNGGSGGNAGWYGGAAGDGGDAVDGCDSVTCRGGDGGRAGRFGIGGNGGDGFNGGGGAYKAPRGGEGGDGAAPRVPHAGVSQAGG